MAETNENKKRISFINEIIDEEVKKLLEDLEEKGRDLDGIIEILKDRVAQSDNPSYAIALARLYEIRLDSSKKKIDILKALVVDKGNEIGAVKRSNEMSTQDILNGGIIAGAIGAKMATDALSMSQNNYNKNILIEELSTTEYVIDHVDVTPLTSTDPVEIKHILEHSDNK